MFAETLRQVGMAFGVGRAKPPAITMTEPHFEVQLIAHMVADLGTVPLSIITTRPLEVAGELMRDRDARHWDVDIRQIFGGRPH